MLNRIKLLASTLLLTLSCLSLAQVNPSAPDNAPPSENTNSPQPTGLPEHKEGETTVPTGQVYRSVDANGKVTFTDAPPKDRPSTAVKIAEPNTLPAEKVTTSPKEQDTDKHVAYTEFSIISPQQDQTFGNEAESVSINAEIKPSLQKGDRVQFFLDGASWGEPIRGLHKQMTNMERGTHTVEASVMDKDGHVLISSGKVSFHIKRISRLNQHAADSQVLKGFSSVSAPVVGYGSSPMVAGAGTNMGASTSASGASSFGQPATSQPAPTTPASK
ncbi:MAG TPA: DUF4124 domain-containing protein [Pseudomonadales bacterium]|nr:DUF4124 domain-containing protein [Pseudomonadales bacterium]